MHRKQLLDYRRKLQEMRQETVGALDSLQQGLGQSLQDSTTELSVYDNHPADIATETYEREKDFALREDQQTRLAEIDAALERIEQGEFGRCQNCGKAIASERLQVLPFAAFCLDCQRKQEDPARSRPIEESLENELLWNSFTDGAQSENVGFDGEDTWQAVARYGTSNTPGDFRQVEDYQDTYIDHAEAIGTVFSVENLPDPESNERAEPGDRPEW